MSIIKNLEKRIDENIMSLIYILLLANILGLTAFLQGSRGNYSLKEKHDGKNLKDVIKSKGKNEVKKKEGEIKTEINKKSTEEYSSEEINYDLDNESGVVAVQQFKKDNVVDLLEKANVVELREIAELKRASSEKANKSLVWHFPK